MSHGRLTGITLANFKSYGPRPVAIDLRPLSLLVGKNNSGKSSVIQALLLLKQTLDQVRGNDVLTFHGAAVSVPASDLRDLTHGWPEGDSFDGPRIALEWTSRIDVQRALEEARWPSVESIASNASIPWLKADTGSVRVSTKVEVEFALRDRRIFVKRLVLGSKRIDVKKSGNNPGMALETTNGTDHDLTWAGAGGWRSVVVEWDHFLPIVSVDRRNVGPRHQSRALANGFALLYDQPLADLKALLQSFAYLSSARPTPPTIYQPVGSDVVDVGIAGERAAHVLHSRKEDVFHYLPPITWGPGNEPRVGETVLERTLLDAVHDVFGQLGVTSKFSTQDIAAVGFTMLFGRATMFHVGRGISYLLPIIELGLLADPLASTVLGGDVSLATYNEEIDVHRHIAIEEPESHMHPAVHSLLAHYFVAMAMSGRQWVIETHSDHLVRRLRRLTAAAPAGSPLETWLSANVSVVEIEQVDGVSTASAARPTPTGEASERWPADFMDRALEEEDAIYLRRVAKRPPPDPFGVTVITHGDPNEDDE